MSLNTQTSVSIGGHQFRYFHSLKLDQTVDGHHTFEIQISYDWLVKLGQGIFSVSKAFLGKEARIVIQPVELAADLKEMTFSGIVTAVHAGKEGDGTHGYCVIRGASPTIVLDNEPHMQTFERQSLSDIVNACLKPVQAHTAKPAVSPYYTDQLKYTVQYKESNYNFLRRLAARYGEWFFYDGQQLHFGHYTPAKVTLTHQVDLIDFDLQLQVMANNTRYSNYEYRQGMDIAQEPTSVGASNIYADHAGTVSNQLYNKPSLNSLTQAMGSGAKGQMGTYAELQQKSRLAQMVKMCGNSANTGIRVGDIIVIRESLFSTADHGEFTVTRLTHYCNGHGVYYNTFEGMPADIAMPQVSLDSFPVCETQSAVVTDNNDPKGMGRVRAKLRWQVQGATTPWMRLVSPHGGGGKGFYFVPEVGEEVMVDFEGGNPELPFVLGTTYSGSSKTAFGDNDNNLKVIKTRSGHTIQMDDTTGEENIVISDIAGNTVTLDTRKGTIKLNAPESILLDSKSIVINATEGVVLNAGESINASAGENISANASKDFLITAENLSNIVENKSTLIANEIEKTAQRVRIDSTSENMELVSSKKIDIQSTEKIRLF